MKVEKLEFVEKYNKKEWASYGGYEEYKQETDVEYLGHDYSLTDDDERACLEMLKSDAVEKPAWFVKLLKAGDLNNEKIEDGLSALNLKITYISNDILTVYDDSAPSDDPDTASCQIAGGELVLGVAEDYEYIYMMNDECKNRGDKPYTAYIMNKKDALLNSKTYEDFKEKMNDIELPVFNN